MLGSVALPHRRANDKSRAKTTFAQPMYVPSCAVYSRVYSNRAISRDRLMAFATPA